MLFIDEPNKVYGTLNVNSRDEPHHEGRSTCINNIIMNENNQKSHNKPQSYQPTNAKVSANSQVNIRKGPKSKSNKCRNNIPINLRNGFGSWNCGTCGFGQPPPEVFVIPQCCESQEEPKCPKQSKDMGKGKGKARLKSNQSAYQHLKGHNRQCTKKWHSTFPWSGTCGFEQPSPPEIFIIPQCCESQEQPKCEENDKGKSKGKGKGKCKEKGKGKGKEKGKGKGKEQAPKKLPISVSVSGKTTISPEKQPKGKTPKSHNTNQPYDNVCQ
ncbi:hypothetical protein F8M41_002514 [Gigaspora margarita]|uniref:Uncharacterized protein n=1 Tax=Gigaspora margarita TaxID=4874 RepID=A0A8H3XCQ9_GIGMA|nr:hypothetical protein F8M41_002514 [Gigaspora margarita]